MKDFLIFTAILFFFSVPVSYYFVRKFFKGSIVYIFGIYSIISTVLLLIEAYGVAKLGTLKDFVWAFPIGLALYIYIFALLKKKVKTNLEILEGKIHDLSMGKLNIDIDEQLFTHNNEVGRIAKALSDLKKSLNNVISHVKAYSTSIADGSKELTISSEQLSQAANEQAASFEEIASTIEEITANINLNAQHSEKAEKISVSSANDMEKVSTTSLNSLENIKNITEKINIINDIAFQTNILAINAAIEASAAGVHGKGFAVVAHEVKMLAEKTKNAADEIISLSEITLGVTEEAKKLITNIIPDISQTAQLVKEINQASKEQNAGSEQINDSVQKLNPVAQQNAALAEELAASAEQLKNYAEKLKELTSYYQV